MAPTLSSVTATAVISTADKWIDVPAAAAISYTDPLGIWDVPSTEYIRTDQNGHKKLFELPLRPGDVVDKYRVEFQGENATDGITLRLVKRAALAAPWAVIDGPHTLWGAAMNNDPVTLASPETVVEGTVIGIEVTSVVVTTAVRLYSGSVHTTSRSL
ncbi:MAG: hypothetical protein M0R06_03900 [Sphaerochaeta sp.]|jgi:hypothetical protein|nr:hypothetical protein [Sphaerochaeta sp.]